MKTCLLASLCLGAAAALPAQEEKPSGKEVLREKTIYVPYEKLEAVFEKEGRGIFLPFGMPQEWLLHKQIFWTEQYLLLALLTDNPRARVLFGSEYLRAFHFDALTRWMGGKAAAGGGSLWFAYGAPASSPAGRAPSLAP